jgi:RNA polymerase sigma-70 factor (ECF subfamily)
MKIKRIQDQMQNCLKQGRKESFDYLYRQHNEAIYLFVYQLTGNRETAEEVTADAFVKLWERWNSLENFSGIKTYLYNTARNAVIDRQRRSKVAGKRHEDYLVCSCETEESTILHAMVCAEFMQEIYAAIDKLPEQCARIIKMIFVEGRGYDEIAADLKLSIHTVYNHRQRGLIMLRKLLRLSAFLFFSSHMG